MSRPTVLAVLGSTGSVGTQTLEVLRLNPGQFRVAVLAAGKNVAALASQVEEFRPSTVVVADDESRAELEATSAGREFRPTPRRISRRASARTVALRSAAAPRSPVRKRDESLLTQQLLILRTPL